MRETAAAALWVGKFSSRSDSRMTTAGEFRSVRQPDQDPLLGLDAEGAEEDPEPVREGLHVLVGQLQAAADDGGLVGETLPHPGVEKLVGDIELLVHLEGHRAGLFGTPEDAVNDAAVSADPSGG